MTGVAQPDVDAYFDSVADWWQDVYREPTTEGQIYRRRLERVLQWVDELELAPGSSVLEVGAGAGVLAVALAGRGHRVLATDSSEKMVGLLRARAEASGLADRLTTAAADVHDLSVPDGSVDLVLAIGVIPWLGDPGRALVELARVARPGASVIVSSDNSARLHYLFDPRRSPALAGLRRAFGGDGSPRTSALWHPYRRAELIAMLSAAGLEPQRLVSLGFGPFHLRGRTFAAGRAGMRSDRALQWLADRGVPPLRSSGFQHLVHARRPASERPHANS